MQSHPRDLKNDELNRMLGILMVYQIFKPKKVGISGGTRISKENEKFCKVLGFELSKEKNIILITGGFKNFEGEVDIPSADFSVVQGFMNQESGSETYLEKIETIIPDPRLDPPGFKRFVVGNEIILNNKNLQSRRFFTVNRSDVLISIQGGKGTREMIDLALALEKPCLPLPFTGGNSKIRWDENRQYIIESLGFEEEIAQELETIDIATINDKGLQELAGKVIKCIMKKLQKKCFIIMPFDKRYNEFYDTVQVALKEGGFEAIRTDKTHLLGNIIDMIRQGLYSSDCIIAEITELKPNVMYEIGLAHAFGKPVIMFYNGPLDKELPFDIKNERIFCYNSYKEIETILKEILKAINNVSSL